MLNYKGRLIDIEKENVMAIVNVTTNSFYDGGRYLREKEFLKNVSKQLKDGALMIDLGGCSTRPNSEPIDEKGEIEAIEWGVRVLKDNFPDIILSIDTYRHKVAEKALNIWGDIVVNDVFGGDYDPQMIDFVASNNLAYIAMHQADIEGDCVGSVIKYFAQKMELCYKKGVKDFIADVGFGFNKSLEQNYQLVREYEKFKILECPTLVGISRKSMIWKVLENSPQEALNGTTVLNTILLTKGANILRVHDAKEGIEAIKIVNYLKSVKF